MLIPIALAQLHAVKKPRPRGRYQHARPWSGRGFLRGIEPDPNRNPIPFRGRCKALDARLDGGGRLRRKRFVRGRRGGFASRKGEQCRKHEKGGRPHGDKCKGFAKPGQAD
jgi:hypothetical protein